MKDVEMNVSEFVNTAVALEKKTTEVIDLKSQLLTFKQLLAEEKKRNDEPKKVEIRTTTPQSKYNHYTSEYESSPKTIDVITTDLTDAVSRIKSELTVTKDSEIESKAETIKKLTKKLKETEESKADFEAKESKRYDKYCDDQKELYVRKAEGLNDRIKALEKDLSLERENKTSAELEKKRKEEIATLRIRIKELERQLTSFMSMSWIKRTWYKATGLVAKIEAERQVAENKQEADKVLSDNSRNYFNPFGFWF